MGGLIVENLSDHLNPEFGPVFRVYREFLESTDQKVITILIP